MTGSRKREVILIVAIALGLGAAATITRWIDQHRNSGAQQFAEQPLYLNGPAAKRLTLAFNGLAADWYWMRSLQYVGRKIIAHQDAHDGQFQLTNLSSLDLRLLASLLDVTTTLDPQFIPAYEYGAIILPEVNPEQAIALLKKGIEANPSSWRLHQHLGYIYWQRKDFQRASEIYAAGASLPDAPPWMTAMSARLKADAGSRRAAGEMYQRLIDSSSDESIQRMVEPQLLRLDSLDERDVINRILDGFKNRNARCVSSWRDVHEDLAAARIEISRLSESAEGSLKAYHAFKFDPSGAPLDPSGMPYRLINDGCAVDLNPKSGVLR